MPCQDGWEYDLVSEATTFIPESSTVNEWDLVCDRKSLQHTATTVYFAGVMVGGLFFGPLSDHTGRRPSLVLCLLAPIFLGILVYFVENMGLGSASQTLMMESFPSARTRVYAICLQEIGFSSAVVVLGVCAYLIRDWRYIQLFIALSGLLSLSYIWLIPESLRWLLTNGKHQEALRYMTKAAWINNAKLPEDIHEKIRVVHNTGRVSEDEHKHNIWETVKMPKLRKWTAVMFFAWFVTAIAYYGLSLSVSRLPGDKYLNFVIAGAVEIVAHIPACWILHRYGRRLPGTVCFITCGVACIASAVTPNFTAGGVDIRWLVRVLAFTGKCANAGLWVILNLFSAEIFPTAIRNAGIGVCGFCARLGALIAPQVALIGDHTHPIVPLVTIGVLAMIAGVLVLLLPDMRGQKLPDTLEEAEAIEMKAATLALAVNTAPIGHLYNIVAQKENDTEQMEPL